MSRFSPGGLLGHPGLSPASNGGPHLPHIKADLDSSSSNHRPSHNNHRGGEKESKFFNFDYQYQQYYSLFGHFMYVFIIQGAQLGILTWFKIYGMGDPIQPRKVFIILLFNIYIGKKKENHIKKPLNAFMLYMKEMRPVVQAECTLKESAAINQILGRRVSLSNWLAWFIIKWGKR